jgi:hypothetical protein
MTMKLDPLTHDLIVGNFQFTEISTTAEDLSQRLKIKLLWFLGEWFLDETYGLPYFQEIFVKGVSLEKIDGRFRTAIARERGVSALLEYSSNYDRTLRLFTVEAKVKTTNGEIVPISLLL